MGLNRQVEAYEIIRQDVCEHQTQVKSQLLIPDHLVSIFSDYMANVVSLKCALISE